MINSKLQRRVGRLWRLSLVVPFVGAAAFTSCSDDLLTGTPSWLGESVMDELETRGNFTETIKLIRAQDDDYESVLRKTGSKTVFVADDDAWANFYKNNEWGVTSLDELTDAQKKILFKCNMINSAYLVEQLGNLPSTSADEDPEEGGCMRRASSIDIMDSVPLMLASQFPEINPVRVGSTSGEQIDHWKRMRGKESALVLQDDNEIPMIHLMPKYMQTNGISAYDVSFLTNGEINTNDSAFVNGVKIKEPDITCQNGYIHVLEGVATHLDNLANVIAAQPQFSIFNRLLDRFSYPTYSETMSEEYQRQYGGSDSVFVKRYFNSHGSQGFSTYDTDDGGTTITNLLPYDPGRNLYTLYSASGITFQEDAAVMLVPTDDAMVEYLQNDGSDLNDRYANAGSGETAWDNAPDEVVLPLLQNVMLTSFNAAIPSQFASINNSASESMGVEEADIDSVLWACNGIIYQTNKVYVAPEYVSVYYPCVIRANDDMNLVYTVVNNDNQVSGGEGFYAYLTNMGSSYSFIIPTDDALQTYYDPVSYNRTDSRGNSTAVAYQFYVNESGRIAANAPLVDWTTLDEKGRGEITSSYYSTTPTAESNNSSGDVFNHFKDILNSSLAVGLFTPGQKFYTARNGGPIVVEWNGSTVTGVAGSFQYERGYYIPVTEIFDKSEEGNGRSYVIEEEPLQSTTVSPYAALSSDENEDKFGTFALLLSSLDILQTDDGNSHATMDRALSNLNNYHYTIYVPTNESIQQLIDAHTLPDPEVLDEIDGVLEDASIEITEEDEAYLTEQREIMGDVISNFVNYHIQDNALYIDGEEVSGSVYETACLDTLTNRFSKLTVDYTRGGSMKVTDNCGNTRTVDSNTNNILTRQYYFNGSSLTGTGCTQIYSSAFAVIHQIDAPLYPSTTSLYDADEYDKVMEVMNKYKTSSVRRNRK